MSVGWVLIRFLKVGRRWCNQYLCDDSTMRACLPSQKFKDFHATRSLSWCHWICVFLCSFDYGLALQAALNIGGISGVGSNMNTTTIHWYAAAMASICNEATKQIYNIFVCMRLWASWWFLIPFAHFVFIKAQTTISFAGADMWCVRK